MRNLPLKELHRRMKAFILNAARRLLELFRLFFFDPAPMLRKWAALPIFFRNAVAYRLMSHDESLRISFKDIYPSTGDRFLKAGAATGHYFHQDLWAARLVFESGCKFHVDVGSRIDGFVAHCLPFCKVTFVDIRPLAGNAPGLLFKQGSILKLPFADGSVESLSCLHVIEHIGLGRYGDQVNPAGHKLAANELSRVLAPGGVLLIGTPVGRERLCFDGHRIFDPLSVSDMFPSLQLKEFSLIDDSGFQIKANATYDDARCCDYGCGLFRFLKQPLLKPSSI